MQQKYQAYSFSFFLTPQTHPQSHNVPRREERNLHYNVVLMVNFGIGLRKIIPTKQGEVGMPVF